MTIRAQKPPDASPWIHLLVWHLVKNLILCLDVSLMYPFSLYQCSPSFFFFNLPLLSSRILHSQHSTVLCTLPLLPETALIVQHAQNFWPHFFILDTALPLFFIYSRVIYLVRLARGALLCQEMKATQNGTRKWPTFWSHNSVLLQLKKICILKGHGCSQFK